jgi:peptide/nickel transport system ATP-binding protein
MSVLVSVNHLSVKLPEGADREYAVQDVSFELRRDDILCLVGESGSGKSVTASSILRLLPPGLQISSGRIDLEGVDVVSMPIDELQRVRGARIGMIFQDPMTALNPLLRVGDQIAEMFRIHTDLPKAAVRAKTLSLLEQMKLPDPMRAAEAYPHELSGGQRQRAMIAMALALEPDVLIADEPTTALDVTTQAQILSLIRELQQRNRMAVLFITHDFGVVAEIGTRIAVMRHGQIVEQGAAADVLRTPRHPYTRTLLAAVPSLVRSATATRQLDSRSDEPSVTRPSQIALLMEGVSKTYRRRGRETAALQNVSLTLWRGTTLGIVGESGSGKSTLARCIVRLLEPDSGRVVFDGVDILKLSRAAWRGKVAKLQMVFQDPYTSLNPRRTAGDLVTQGPIMHGMSKTDAYAKARRLFELVGLDPQAMSRYPHEFSGGQRQRIGLARALALDPQILVADEPVSALDVSVQAQVLELLADLRDKLGLSVIFITHDLRVAAQVCDRLAIMQGGRVVEEGPASEVLSRPVQEYSKALLAAVPGRAWQSTFRDHQDRLDEVTGSTA